MAESTGLGEVADTVATPLLQGEHPSPLHRVICPVVICAFSYSIYLIRMQKLPGGPGGRVKETLIRSQVGKTWRLAGSESMFSFVQLSS